MELPYGWAGSIMVESDVGQVEDWCENSIVSPFQNIHISVYSENLCELFIRKEKDFVLATLRWA
jgi:hypothetical protein